MLPHLVFIRFHFHWYGSLHSHCYRCTRLIGLDCSNHVDLPSTHYKQSTPWCHPYRQSCRLHRNHDRGSPSRYEEFKLFLVPGKGNLFKADEKSPPLSEERAKLFHWMIVWLLFASKRARPNFQVCVAFLYTRVKHSTKQDYKKLARVIYQLFARNHSFTIDSQGKNKWKSNLEYGCIIHYTRCILTVRVTPVRVWRLVMGIYYLCHRNKRLLLLEVQSR